MVSKAWYESKTVWLNVITALLAVAPLFLPGGEFTDLLGEMAVRYIALGVAVVNVILRVWFTDKPIG